MDSVTLNNVCSNGEVKRLNSNSLSFLYVFFICFFIYFACVSVINFTKIIRSQSRFGSTFWLELGAIVVRKKLSQQGFTDIFKYSAALVDYLFQIVAKRFPFIRCKHLLWALYYLKTRNTNEREIAALLNTNTKTLRIHVVEVLSYMEASLPEVSLLVSCVNCLTFQFDFESRFNNWPHCRPSCLADTKFVKTSTPYLNSWHYYKVNKNTYGLVYQVVVSLGKPFRILSFDGPYKGAASDVSIIRDTIIPKLQPDELVMCDKVLNRSV